MEQMLALGRRHPQSPAQSFDGSFRRVGRTALLESGDVVDRDPAELREFLPPQPGRATMPSDG